MKTAAEWAKEVIQGTFAPDGLSGETIKAKFQQAQLEAIRAGMVAAKVAIRNITASEMGMAGGGTGAAYNALCDLTPESVLESV